MTKKIFIEFIIFFKISGRNPFIWATFKYILLKVDQLNLFIEM